MLELNPFLVSIAEPSKGGGRFIEDPAAVENIVFQTRGAALSAFELRLANALMTAFDDGVAELDDLVVALNASGVRDVEGDAWTAESLSSQLALSAQLFAPVGDAR